MADRTKLIWYNISMKKEMKAVYFTVGLLLGLALMVVGMVRVATADEMKMGRQGEAELKEGINSLVAETDQIRSERGADDPELIVKEAELSDKEAELLAIQKGVYEERKKDVWLDNVPLFIAGVFSIGVAVVIYKYA